MPTALVAATLKVYAVAVRQAGERGLVPPVVVAVAPPGLATTVYPVIGLPPSAAPLLDTVADRSCATAATPVGCAATGATAPVAPPAAPPPVHQAGAVTSSRPGRAEVGRRSTVSTCRHLVRGEARRGARTSAAAAATYGVAMLVPDM